MFTRLLWIVATCPIAFVAEAAPPAPAPPVGGAPTRLDCVEYQWKRGDPPVRMMKKDEGVCYLSQVQGTFSGGGESVGVYIDEEGYWCLGGTAAKEVTVSAIAVRFPGKLVVNLAKAPSGRMLADLTALAKGERPKVREAAEQEMKAATTAAPDPEGQFAMAREWLSLAADEPSALKGTMVAHAIELLRAAAPGLSEGLAAQATKLADEQTVAFAAKYLNDLSMWGVLNGTWEATADGKIRGAGDSNITFRMPLPSDAEISFHLMVVEGMRPRIHFEGTDLFVGNEGYERVLEAHGAAGQRGVKFPYRHNQDIAVTVKLSEANFELWFDGKQMAKGARRKTPPTMTLRLSGGDGWSPGTVLYWGFDFKAVPKPPAAAEVKP